MTRDWPWLTLLSLGLVGAACATPSILGGPTTDTTTQVCPDGTRCKEWQDCPSLASPGVCQMPSGGIVSGWGQEGWGKRRVDAGADED